MNFKDAADAAHRQLCEQLKVSPDWVKVKFENIPMWEYIEWLGKIPLEKSKFLQVEFDHIRNDVVYAEYLVAPEYAGVA